MVLEIFVPCGPFGHASIYVMKDFL